MTKNINGHVVIYQEAKQQCDLCGKIAELRPYGPNGEMICYDCGKKNPETTKRRFDYMITGGDERWGSFEQWWKIVQTRPNKT